jgi:hypothetical protein
LPIIPYAQRALNYQFQLGDSATNNVLTVSGLRSTVTFQNAIGQALPIAIIRIFGLTLNQMNRLTVAGLYLYNPSRIGKNTISISAGIIGSQLTTIFTGTIIEAYPDGNQPDMGFFIRATANVALQYNKVPPTTFNGSTSSSTVMQTIATKAGLQFENNNVTSILSYPYFAGTAKNQLVQAAHAAGAYVAFDPILPKVAIWPKINGARQSSGIVVSPATGMINYPMFESGGIKIRTIYDPSLIFEPGKPFEVQSQFTAASGQWLPASIGINLSSLVPKGPWEIEVSAFPQQYPPQPVGTQ